MSKREQLEEMLQASPDDEFLQYAVAMAYASEGDNATAIQRLEQVTAKNPDYVAAYFQQGQLLAKQGDIDAARDVVRNGIDVARRVNDDHAAAEMTEFLETL